METWNGITLAEVRSAYLVDRARGLYSSVRRLVFANNDPYKSAELTFETAANGAVIVNDGYTSWKFVAPEGFTVERGSTVAELFDGFRAACAASPVPAWEKFALWFGEKGAETMNAFLTEGGGSAVTDANGNTWAAAQRACGGVSSFPELIDWVRSWCGAEFLAADSGAVCAAGNTIRWSFTVAMFGADVRLGFTFLL